MSAHDLLLTRQAIVDTVVRYATGVDRRDWTLYASCFTDPFDVDMSSWNGRPAVAVSREEWIERVRGTNGNFDATQHLSTNHVVTVHSANDATCVSEMQAQHFFQPSTMERLGAAGEINWCTLGGHYTNLLMLTDDGWQIRSCTLTIRWTTGNPDIFALARARSGS